MKISTLRDSKAASKYPTIPGCVFVAECDAGHAILCCPQPGEYVPIVANGVTRSSVQEYMVHVPLSMTFLHVRASFRGQGIGYSLVERCKFFAKRRGLPISLRALPYGQAQKTMSLKELLAFYERCGFAYAGKHDTNAYMIWTPE